MKSPNVKSITRMRKRYQYNSPEGITPERLKELRSHRSLTQIIKPSISRRILNQEINMQDTFDFYLEIEKERRRR